MRPSSLQHAPKERDLALEANQVLVPALALERLRLKQYLLQPTRIDVSACEGDQAPRPARHAPAPS